MKVEDIKPGITKVQTCPNGPALTVKSVCGRLVKLVLVEDAGIEKEWGLCPASMVDEVK